MILNFECASESLWRIYCRSISMPLKNVPRKCRCCLDIGPKLKILPIQASMLSAFFKVSPVCPPQNAYLYIRHNTTLRLLRHHFGTYNCNP